MLQDSIILHTKLQPPRVLDIIHRERFASLVSQFKEKKLITVTAGAGYGKTTFVIDSLNELDAKAIWYRLDKSDKDFMTFFYYIFTGVRRIYPDFGGHIISLLSDPEGGSREHSSLLTLLINDFERMCDEDLFIVLDDFHLVRDSQEIMNGLEFILNNLPIRMHLILISRLAIELPLSRLRSMREVLDVDEKDLRFNDSDIKRLFLEVFELPISKNHIAVLQEKISGWISGLVLFYHMLKDKTEVEIEKVLKNLKGSSGEIYAYLEENVFSQLSPDTQSFLIKTSILPWLSSDFCDQLLSINNSKEILGDLKGNYLFTFSLGDKKEGYMYHDLLKDFLQEKLRNQIDVKATKELHAKIAAIYEEQGEHRTALDHYLMADCMEDVSRIIGLFAWTWIRQGQVQQIKSLLENIPKCYLEKDPWFLYLQAGLKELSGRPQDAISHYNMALEAFRDRSLDDEMNVCIMQLASSYFTLGDYKEAEPLFKELLSWQALPPALKTTCLGCLLSITFFVGKVSDSDNYTEQAFSILSQISGEEQQIILGKLHMFLAMKFDTQGRVNDAFENAKKGKETLQHLGQDRMLSLCYLFLSHAHYRYGQFKEGIDVAIESINIIEKLKFKDKLLPAVYFLLGLNYLGLSLKDKAKYYAQQSLEISREIFNFHSQAMAYRALFLISFDAGDMRAAEEYIQQGLEVIKHNIDLPVYQGILELDLASVMTEKGEHDNALKIVQSVEEKIQHLEWSQAKIYFEYARCYSMTSQIDKAIKVVIKGLSLCETNGYDLKPFMLKAWIIPLLVDVYARGEKKNNIRNILIKMGSEAVNELSRIIESNTSALIKDTATNLFNELRRNFAIGLKIHFFGKFRLFMGETELPVNKWKSKKALQLFKYFVHSRHRGYLSKEVLMELLWPDEDPAKSANRFHVLLASMRKDLEPNLAKGVPSAYIQSNGSAYMLDIGKDGWVDIEEFSNEIKHAKTSKDPEESISRYLNAISLYQGDFLEEDLYIDWCADVRERYKEDYLYALKEVIKFYEKQKAFDKCIEYASIYLKTEKYAEEIYQVLMRCHSGLSNTAMMVKTFEKCKKAIQNELNCSLSHETLDLYQALNPN